MSEVQMPAEHLAAVSAFEANDIVALYRSPNRDSRHQRCRRRHGRALDEATERAMHCRNQSRNLINVDTILRDILRTISATRLRSTICALLSQKRKLKSVAPFARYRKFESISLQRRDGMGQAAKEMAPSSLA